ncbi:helix-hairpin-helix domain-containing protein [Lactobacillus kalixensis]|uniref:Late competence protein required for DNA binding and uptake n=1 Tax=Lactobacillus kalixensis DSM 16043 TaxID=1423763 RepID=A0A0R1UD14_9LACO|nr:helix-hairpin-helix domain-containing protein [Lactobacillus kalixensis]KRL91319.1 late competence protein required for DNA binding and uptake [Lactobacillus kalixensis DSM 16043]
MKLDFEKIKMFLIEKKKYLLIIVAGIAIFFFMKNSNSNKEANQLGNNNISQNSSSFSSSTSSSMQTSNTTQSESKEVTVDISGAVKHGGVYTLKNGARLQELIEAAGGLKDNAQVKAINRAVMLKDQDKIHIPYKGEKVENATTVTSNGESTPSTSGTSSSQTGDKVNINTASAADLQKLNGIGEKKAEQIIAYRDQNGQFKKIEDLMQVSGIGEKTFAALKDQLAI